MNSIISSEENLIAILKEVELGNLSAFGVVVKNYQHYAFSVAFRCLSNEEDAKDVVQESFIKIWKNIGSFNGKVKFTTWMYKIVINLCYDKLRMRKRAVERCEELNEEIMESCENLEKLYVNKEQAEIIKYISDRLPKKQRFVFVLRDLEGLAAEEVSQVLDISIQSVKTNLSLARKEIRTRLIKWRT